MSASQLSDEELKRWLVGESARLQELRSLILRIAPSFLAVWVEGETGVGKEQVALALHAASGRTGRFVAVNVTALADTMFEDALFGHERGAFTGAVGERRGYLEEADGGTLFLDEIGGLSLSAQSKLLRAIETKTFRRVGGHTDRTSNFRVVVAANEPLGPLVATGRFRADLAFRLRGAFIQVPTLRARPDDIGVLANHFLSRGETPDSGRLSVDAMRWLRTQSWWGNVRELRQLLDCAQVMSSDGTVGLHDLRVARSMVGLGTSLTSREARADSSARGELLAILVRHDWNTEAVARELRIDRTTVYRRMRRFGIDTPRSTRAPDWRLGAATGRPTPAQEAPMRR